ncbi:MAG: acetyl-CoA carboxylase biotin carboxyl carrier protein subunit [Promethearchaeota archaeon]
MPRKYELKINGTTINVEVDGPSMGILSVTIGEATFPVKIDDGNHSTGTYRVTVGDQQHILHITPQPETSEYTLKFKKQTYATGLKPLGIQPTPGYRPMTFPSSTPSTAGRTVESAPSLAPQEPMELGSVTAPLPGRIIELRVQENTTVKAGDVLLVLEAMKMANEIRAPQSGTVKKVHIQAGDTVEKGQPMITIG